jgi:hypothetical protein
LKVNCSCCRKLENRFILRKVEFCIAVYHKIRNFVVSLIHQKLMSLHSKLKTIKGGVVTGHIPLKSSQCPGFLLRMRNPKPDSDPCFFRISKVPSLIIVLLKGPFCVLICLKHSLFQIFWPPGINPLHADSVCIPQNKINLDPYLMRMRAFPHKEHRLKQRSKIFTNFDKVLWIRDILVRIRIRRSVPPTYGSGSCFFRQGLRRCQQKIYLFCSLLFEGTFTSVFKKKSQKEVTKNSRNQDLSYFFADLFGSRFGAWDFPGLRIRITLL